MWQDRAVCDLFEHAHHELLGLMAPRPFLLIGGESADGRRSRPYIEAAMPVYHLYSRSARFAFFNYEQGDQVPPKAEAKLYDWLETYL